MQQAGLDFPRWPARRFRRHLPGFGTGGNRGYQYRLCGAEGTPVRAAGRRNGGLCGSELKRLMAISF